METIPKSPWVEEVSEAVRTLLMGAAWWRAARREEVADEMVADAVRTIELLGRPPARPRKRREAELPRAPTVLVVDDDELIRQAIAATLEDDGYAVVCCGNGAEAVEWIRTNPGAASTVLLDVMMPVMDGVEFLATRRSDPLLAQVPVVVMSAVSLADVLGEYGLHDRLAKPFKVERLLHAVGAATGAAPTQGGRAPAASSKITRRRSSSGNK